MGTTLTINAMGCQFSITDKVVDASAGFVLALKIIKVSLGDIKLYLKNI